MEVDWAGDTLTVFEEAIGETIKAYVFVACLPCSLYSYAEAFPDMKSPHWIEAHVHAYSFFEGVTRILVPDNLRTGVIKNTRTELVLNRSYQEMAEYYGTAIIPARPRSPKDYRQINVIGNLAKTW
jgi:transposase